ncbi:hypothetical protein BKP45_20085 [Anaerobacillus alkalidiazotrophicus]|uniref:Swarming motility protein SwrB n=1 Tax=Anaerobacillus alkalidiazotrophicus TaxID=472963 RepID=A0A1S2LZJ7_9BACI|nr:hypothetical protein [Anaerobacillus alkalidiazotrophicus]OIJ17862.1 hypothetical protein BKP45_20085 [Anaerobacillus alkalidiazotrophicus]
MAYLLAVSFLLHFVSFYLIIVLIQKTNSKKGLTETNELETIKREIEDLLISYTTEMKEENEKLLSDIERKRKTKGVSELTIKSNYDKDGLHVNFNKKNSAPLIQKNVLQKVIEKDDAFTPPLVSVNEDSLEQSNTAKVLSYAKQGYTSKEIAKKLNMGDGEVELLLKFHK